jgi:hypothetical protein
VKTAPSFNEAFASIRVAIPTDCEAVILYRRKQFFDPSGHTTAATVTEYETGFAFHADARTAHHFFERVERLARKRLRDETAAAIFVRWPGLRAAWSLFDSFDLDEGGPNQS